MFLEAWRRRRDVQLIDDSARPWLLGVANNLLRNAATVLGQFFFLKKKKSHINPTDDVAGRLADEARMSRVLDLV